MKSVSAIIISIFFSGLSSTVQIEAQSLDTMSFHSDSEPLRSTQLTDLLHHYYDPSANRSGQTLANSGYDMTWLHFATMGNLSLGTIGNENLLDSAKFTLLISRLDSEGFVYQGFNNPLWPFPNYESSQGTLLGWEFENGNTEGWDATNTASSSLQAGRWVIETPFVDPFVASPDFSVQADDAPFLQIRIRCLDGASTDCSDVTGQLFWQRSDAQFWSPTRSKFFSLLGPAENPGTDMITYLVQMEDDEEWSGTITKLRFDPMFEGATGRIVEIDSIEFAYDSRLPTNNPNFVLAAYNYYFTSGDSELFTLETLNQGTVFDRVRKAVDFMKVHLGGGSLEHLRIDWKGHNGLPGKTESQVRIGDGIQNSIYDVLPLGYDDVYATIYFFAALKAIAALEREVVSNPQWNVAPNPFGESASSYEDLASRVKAKIASTFWLPQEGRLMASRDIQGTIHDIGHVGLNLEAIYYDAVESSKAETILDWISGERTVSTDLSRGADIYAWDFAPRVTTRDTSDWYIWPMYLWFGVNLTNPPGALWGQQVQNGGGWFWQSYYDIIARLRHRSAEDAWNRLVAILDWYQSTQDVGGFEAYYATNQGTLQGCGSAGNIGLDCEFIENALVPLSVLYGFMGFSVSEDGLGLAPRLPSGLDHLEIRRLHFRKHFYDVSTSRSGPAVLVIRTHPETGITGFGNSAHILPIAIGELDPGASFSLRITDLQSGSVTDAPMTVDADGILRAMVSMPKDGAVEVRESAIIFSDGFESGNLSRWSE